MSSELATLNWLTTHKRLLVVCVVGGFASTLRYGIYPAIFPGLRYEPPMAGAAYVGMTLLSILAILIVAAALKGVGKTLTDTIGGPGK